MKEPVLSPTGKPKTYSALRVLYLHGWLDQSYAVRHEGKNGEFIRRCVTLTGKSATGQGKIEAREAKITRRAFEDVFAMLAKTHFWNLPTTNDAGGLDGSYLLIEVIKDGKHRVFVRWAPESKTGKRRLSGIVDFYRFQFRRAGFWPVQSQQNEQKAAEPKDTAPAKAQP